MNQSITIMPTFVGMSTLKNKKPLTNMSNFAEEINERLEKFPERLDAAIKKTGMSKLEFADELGFNRNTVTNYLNGRAPKIEFVIAIAIKCNERLEWLLGLEEERGESPKTVEELISEILKLPLDERLRVLRVLSSLHV